LTQFGTVQIRSGTTGTPVNQTTSPDLEVTLEAV